MPETSTKKLTVRKYHLSDSEVDFLEKRILEKKTETLAEVARLKTEIGESPADDVVIRKRMDTHRNFIVRIITPVLQMIEGDRRLPRSKRKYGYCQDTGDRLSFSRLVAVPWALRSVDAMAEHENYKIRRKEKGSRLTSKDAFISGAKVEQLRALPRPSPASVAANSDPQMPAPA